MTFEILVLITITACFLIAFLYLSFKSLNNWRNSSLIQAEIIGYKWSKLPARKYKTTNPITGFWPIIQYKTENQTVRATIKNISLLIPEKTRIKVRMADKNNHVKMEFLYSILLLGLLAVGILYKTVFIDILFPAWFLGLIFAIFIYLRDNYNNFGTLQDTFKYISPQCPDNYESLNKDYFEKIEESDLVTYEEAMAHYYHQNKKSEKWLYPLIAIGLALMIAYKILS